MSRLPQSFIRDYFKRFPTFRYDRSKETMQQFRLLAEQEKWEDYKRKQEKRELKTALVLQFNETFGKSEKDIKGWHEMCRVMGINPVPKTAYECKELFRRTHVNLVDLVDARGTANLVPTFPTERALALYSEEYEKYFPLKHAKAGKLLKFLLRHIGSPRY